MATTRICSVPDCSKAAWKRNMCQAHYTRWRRHGDPLGGRVDRGAVMPYVQNTVLPYEGDGCLIWPYGRSSAGYGKLRVSGKTDYVHRYVCQQVHGEPVPPATEAAHLCGNGHLGCVNPKHLAWKTHAENQQDRLAHGTHLRGERNKNAKFTWGQVADIRQATGEKSVTKIAKEYGVSYTTIDKIVKNLSWVAPPS